MSQFQVNEGVISEIGHDGSFESKGCRPLAIKKAWNVSCVQAGTESKSKDIIIVRVSVLK